MGNFMSVVEVNMQAPSSSPKFNTDGRTDGLTKTYITFLPSLTSVTRTGGQKK